MPRIVFIFALLTSVSTSAFGQKIIWQSIEPTFSFGKGIFHASQGNYITFGRSGFARSYLKIINDDAEVLLIDTIDIGRGIISKLIPRDDSTLLIVTFDGYLFSYNKNSYERKLLVKLDSIKSITTVFEDQEHYIIRGSFYENQKNEQIRIILNKQTLDVVQYIKIPEKSEYTVFLKYNADNNYFIEGLSSRMYFEIIKTDLDSNVLWKYRIHNDSINWMNLSISSNNEIFLLGTLSSYAYSKKFDDEAVVVKLSENGNLQWERRFKPTHPKSNRWDFRKFYKVLYWKNRIYLVGTTGYAPAGPISKLSAVSMDMDGKTLWEFEKYIYGEGSVGVDVVVNDKDELIITGTCGISDYGRPDRAFILKLGDINTSSINVSNDEPFFVYPNPVNDILNVRTAYNYNQYFIKNIQGKAVKYGAFHPSIDVSQLPAAMYLIELKGKENQIMKFIKN